MISNGKDNCKKILCYNMLNKKKCNYGNKCMYAHSLAEQKIEPLRHKIYSIIKYNTDLSNIDLSVDHNLYENLLQLTRVCSLCSKGQCPGGYNCRNGAINYKLRICYDDLVYGHCKRVSCHSVHLTEKGLKCYNKTKNDEIFINVKEPEDSKILNDDINEIISTCKSSSNDNRSCTLDYRKIINENNNKPVIKNNNQNNKFNKKRQELNDVTGILLTESFFLNQLANKNNCEDNSSESDKGEDVEKMIEYFNNNSSDDESIFLV